VTRALGSLAEVAPDYDVIVLDQWGVLHDGTTPYPGVVEALTALIQRGQRFAVLSNSGKRAAPNAARIAAMGFDMDGFDQVMTSGEAMWLNVQSGAIGEDVFFPIERQPGDAAHWADGLSIQLADDVRQAQAVLLMGLPDGASVESWQGVLDTVLDRNLTVYCTNPDKASPRAGGQSVTSPGALAAAYEGQGGRVVYFGKPHRPIFDTLAQTLNLLPQQMLMVGDSLEHDIAGAHHAGWDSLFIRGGLYHRHFASGDVDTVLADLVQQTGAPAPTFTLEFLR
jgi:HAD superfamily hydrolase (TIGR01459 family)